MSEWTEDKLQKLINDEVEESLNLEYKRAGALCGTDGKKKEITKDVSSMANSDGGVIIYGIKEYDDKNKSHLPEELDPVDNTIFSKERLEQVINNIRPKIEALQIHPVHLSSGQNDFAYVIDIPKSNTAHQATDKKYYKRFNFQSVAMDDYEVRDVMNRLKYPKIDIEFKLQGKSLLVHAINASSVLANNVYIKLLFDKDLLDYNDDRPYYFFKEDDKVIIMIENRLQCDMLSKLRVHGQAYNRLPILPQLTIRLGNINLNTQQFETIDRQQSFQYEIYADNAPMRQGKIAIRDIPTK